MCTQRPMPRRIAPTPRGFAGGPPPLRGLKLTHDPRERGARCQVRPGADATVVSSGIRLTTFKFHEQLCVPRTVNTLHPRQGSPSGPERRRWGAAAGAGEGHSHPCDRVVGGRLGGCHARLPSEAPLLRPSRAYVDLESQQERGCGDYPLSLR